MRVIALIFVAAMCLLAGARRADAEKVKTNQSAKLYARPGEQAKVLLTVKSGQNMTLLNEDGRWLKVRVQGRTGYVPRSKVDMADDGGIARNTRRRPFVDGRNKRRGFGGDAPDDRVGADATGEGGGDEAEEEEEEEEEEKPAAKKPPEKKVAKVEAKKAPPPDDEEEEDEEEEEEDEEEDNPLPEKKTAAKEPDEEEVEEKEPARARARVAKKVKVFEKPDEESEDSFIARPTDTLFPTETKGSWTFVENSEGDAGWIMTSELQMEGGGGGGGGGFGKKQIDVRARVGFMFLQQGMRTQGSMNPNKWPDNYDIGTSAAMVSLGGGILIPRGNKLLGAEVTYDYAKTLLGGVNFDTPTDQVPATSIGLTVHYINARLMAGLDFKKKSGMTLFGRLGYHYQGYLVTDVTSMTANPAKLPSETVKGPTIGAALALPTFTNKIGLRFALDAIVFGAGVSQTLGLQDGTSPSAKLVDVGVLATYRWKKSFALQLGYDLHYLGIDFGAPLMSSTRGHTGTNVARTDLFHLISFGIAKPF